MAVVSIVNLNLTKFSFTSFNTSNLGIRSSGRTGYVTFYDGSTFVGRIDFYNQSPPNDKLYESYTIINMIQAQSAEVQDMLHDNRQQLDVLALAIYTPIGESYFPLDGFGSLQYIGHTVPDDTHALHAGLALDFGS